MAGMIKQPRTAEQQQVGAAAFGVPPPAEEPMPAEEPVPGEDPGMEGDEDYENDPSYQAAMKFVFKGLHEAGAADNINRSIKKAKDKVEAAANLAYELVSVAGERVGGVEPEVLVPLAMDVLEEVLVIAEASGVVLSEAEQGSAVKLMILRWAGEQGMDTRQLQAAMDKVTPEDFSAVLASVGDTQAAAPEGAV
jgi:hypothetical protein